MLSPSTTMRGTCGTVDRAGATGALDTSFRSSGWRSGLVERPQETAASTRKGTSKRYNLSILLSYTPVGGHHRLSTGAGARASGARTRPARRGGPRAHAGAESIRPQARGRSRPALHAGRSVAARRRYRAGNRRSGPAAGNGRYLALVHSRSGTVLAQGGRIEEASASFRQAERLAAAAQAHDVLGIICNNQANVALIQHRHEHALALSERSAALEEQIGPGRGLALCLATLGQILVHVGQLERAEKVLHRALQVRSPSQFHEITGAVFDSLAQIALTRGGYESAGDYLRQAGEAYGGYGAQTSKWYEWSIRVLEAKLAARRR